MQININFYLITLACDNKTVQIKSLITGSDIHDLPTFEANVTCLATSKDSKQVYVACSDSKLYLYNILTRDLIAVLIEQTSSINDLEISKDGSFLFSSSGVSFNFNFSAIF
jgi:WD40 repeat protein